jgi:signal transduction histidine kinase
VADLDDRSKTGRDVYNPVHDRWLELRVRWTPSGNSVALRIDVSELKRLQQEVLRAQRVETIGRTSAGVAHDFNNLLTVIISTLELINLRADNPARVATLAATALESAESGARLVRQLLTYARRDVTQPELLDPNAVLTGIAALLRRTAGSEVMLTFKLGGDAGGLGLARFDPSQFEGALINLVMNARYAVEAAWERLQGGGLITLTTARHAGENGDMLAISVADNGIGMPEDIAAHAFEPFFTTRGVGGGSGLGLSQVYGFAAGAGGQTRIDSTPGAGTTVTILLPYEPDA